VFWSNDPEGTPWKYFQRNSDPTSKIENDTAIAADAG